MSNCNIIFPVPGVMNNFTGKELYDLSSIFEIKINKYSESSALTYHTHIQLFLISTNLGGKLSASF